MINAFANIFGNTGYAIHARNFFRSLNRHVPVCLAPKFGGIPNFDENDSLYEMMGRLPEIDVHAITINLDEPEEMYRFGGKKRIGYTVFETQILSEPAVHQLKQLDQVWVPTHWGKNILIQQGVAAEKVCVVPEGINPHIFQPTGEKFEQIEKIPGFRFLAVGKWEERKGVKELLTTFDRAFTTEEVFLVVHFQSDVRALKSINVKAEIDQLNLKRKEKIIVIETPLKTEMEMSKLYRSCHAFVSASKAEGWGLPILEAMACGLPTIAPLYSGPTEFLTTENSWPLVIREFEDVYCPTFFPEKGLFGKWAKIPIDELVGQMRKVYSEYCRDPQSLVTKGQKVSEDVHRQWTWDHAAKKAISFLKAHIS